jgi:electron transport complex protein RnfC
MLSVCFELKEVLMDKLIDYSKFKLKPGEEISGLVQDKNSFVVVNCGKCYNEFTVVEPAECGELFKILSENNKTVVDCVTIDFLCNKHHLQQHVAGLKDSLINADAVLVNACGVGMQTIAGLIEDKPVYTAADTVPQGGYHGIALHEDKCAACANCYLTMTQGICPITNCSKELLNGQCGGCKKGKCEVSKDKDCGWEKIYNRLQQTGFDSSAVDVKIHKYNKPDFKTANKYNNSIREKRNQNFYGGLYPFELKMFTADKPIQDFPDPGIVVIPLAQHTGAPCEPMVKPGDIVRVGQKIGDVKSFVSAPVHSSVSGKVMAVEPRSHPAIPVPVMAVVIQSDGKNTFDKSVQPYKSYENLTKDQLIDIVREKGIVGLGGAQFPTHVKLKSPKPVDTLLLNGCECEPFLTADDRMMIEHAEGIVTGMKILMKILGLTNGIIVVENNKPEAVKSLVKSVEELGLTGNITVNEVPTKYPQGAERMLIKKTLGRQVPPGGLPLDVGVVVNNVSTAYAVYDAIENGIPLIKRVITVTGMPVKNKLNLRVKIGTSITEILEYCSAEFLPDKHVMKMGGPMMGLVQNNPDVPVIKGTTGLVITGKPDIELDRARQCIKCGRCVDVCPMELYPLYYWYGQTGDKTEHRTGLDNSGIAVMDGKNKHSVANCIECGCCEYICSSKLPLVQIIKEIKKEMRDKKG